MTNKLTISLILMVLILPLSVFAGGKKEKDGRDEGGKTEAASAVTEEPAIEDGANTVAAVVNGSEISMKAVELDLVRFKEQLMNSGRSVSDEDDGELREVVIDGLIDRELLFQATGEMGFRVSEIDVEERLQAIRSQFSDDSQYVEAMAMENVTEEDLRQDLFVGLSIQKLLEEKVYPDVSVTESDVQEFYNANTDQFRQPEMVQASHILILLDPDADETVRAEAFDKIEGVQDKLKAGADFADLAKQYSEGPSNVQGGDLGFFGRGQMVPPFEEAAFSLGLNQVSGIVETQFGLHLVKVYDKVSEELLSFDTVKSDIEGYLLQLGTNAAVEQYTASLRAGAEITVFF